MEARWYQEDSIAATFDYFYRGGTGNPLIALPTGTGKGFVIAEMIRRIMFSWPTQRVLMLTHVKKLISQNYAKLLDVWPNAPVGIYSAGLKQRDTALPIIMGGIASVVKKIPLIGWRDVLFIDEAHLLGPAEKSMYQFAILELLKINPKMVVIGLTATPYRLGQGMLTDDGLFTDIVFDMTDIEGFNRLIAEGFLCLAMAKKTQTEIDVSSIKIEKGEYSKGGLAKAVADPVLLRKILTEMCYEGANRNAWMIFASGIDNSELVAEMLREEFHVSAECVHSKMASTLADERVKAFEAGQIRCIVNNNVLTTGFDYPPVDLIGMLRPTLSPGLWVQMVGRGTRPSPETDKRDCLVLDFAGNSRRLGPINDPVKPRPKGAGGGDAPVRVCDQCGIYNPASARVCFNCGYEFTFKEKLFQSASTSDIVRSDAPVLEWFNVQRVLYNRHVRKTRPGEPPPKPCIKVSYLCGLAMFNEWVHPDAEGAGGKRARDWWRERHAYEPPKPDNCGPFNSATDAMLSIIAQLKQPKRIQVHVNRPHPEVKQVEY